MKASQINKYLFFKLPAAWFCGVRVQTINEEYCTSRVKHRWINQNPFHSMFWAVQGMAAELSTGALVMNHIRKQDQRISMLVISNSATFHKKARGIVHFSCKSGDIVAKAVENAIKTGLPQEFWLASNAVNEQDEAVSSFNFQWSIKVKQ